jgi:cell division protein FtsW (lipid II flippase)
MQTLLFKMANFLSMLGDDPMDVTTEAWYQNVVQPILNILDALLVPLLIIVGTAGSIYAIVLGVNYSKAETADKREEAKKRMINAIIGLVLMVLLLIILQLFVDNATIIAEWITGGGKPTVTE